MTILVLDDDQAIANFLAKIGQVEGHHCLALTSPNEAIENVQNIEFDLAVVGFVMPGRDGTEVAKDISRLSPRTRIIITTEEVPDALKRRLRALSYDFDYMPLPAEPEDIRHRFRWNAAWAKGG